MNPTLKRHLISFLITFLSVFSLTIGASFTVIEAPDALTSSVILSMVVSAARTAIKAAFEGISGR